MRRLVYSPKVECLIYREDARELLDVTPDIVQGTVNRRLNAASDMQLTLQNKNGRYTKNHTIKPMDRIVVRMSRVGKPFLVFSGFVDDAPNFQLYPGTVTVAASCTLKLLQHTMFDPGALYVRGWFQQHGWSYDPDSGALFVGQPGVGNDDLYGTVGDIISALLIEIGNWPKDAITIYDLPSAFLTDIAKLMQDVSNTSQDIYEDNAKLLAKLFGTADIHPSGSTGIDTTGPLPTTGNISIEDVARVALAAGFSGDDAVIAVAIAGMESGFRTDATNTNTDSSTDYGLWQINSSHSGDPLFNGDMTKAFDPRIAAQYTYKLYSSRKSSQGTGCRFADWTTYRIVNVNPNGGCGFFDWNSGSSDLKSKWATLLAQAQAAVTKAALGSATDLTKALPTSTDTTTQRTKTTKWSILDGNTAMITGGTSPYSNLRFASQVDWQHVIPYLLSTVNNICRQHNVIADVNSGYRSNTYSQSSGGFSGDPHSKGVAIDAYVNGQPICTSSAIPASEFSDAGIRLGSSFIYNGNPDNEHLDMMDASGANLNTTAQKWLAAGGTGTYTGTDTTASQDSGTFTKEDILRLGTAAGFYTQQLQGSDIILSQMLTGRRALANDISLMEWIDNLVPSSGRVYCSTPSGSFLTFFPDRWGFFERTPYFFITDTEIVDLTINENDTNLTTHVFTTGPLIPASGIQNYDRMNSMVASVEEDAFKYFIHPPKDFSPIDFLARYGARPYPNDVMNVNNPLLLWMNGWMKFMELWSSRFTASASFTFMPELFPGGRVSLGNRVEMFVESVSHTFDLAGGFSTTSELSSIVDQTGTIDDLTDPSQGFGPQVQQELTP